MATEIQIEEDDGFFHITAPYDEDFKEDLKTDLNARWDPTNKVWKVNASDYDIRQVEQVCKLHFPKAFK